MVLKEKERMIIEDLKTQEQNCIDKYGKYAKQAKDPVLKDLFKTIMMKEEKHLNTLDQVLNGTVPDCDVNDEAGDNYQPVATYSKKDQSEEKKSDCFLATDCIASEKLVSGEYNTNVFIFGDAKIRKLLAELLVEEQNHAEMLWKYKTVNGMA